jgi:hypothetical protein
MGTSFRTAFSIPKKKMAAVWAGHRFINKSNLSLSARVLQRKPIRQPAQKLAVILYPNKRVKYDPVLQKTHLWSP